MPPIEFWFDFASTYSYPAAMRIESVAKANGVYIVWRPFLLGAIFNKQGLRDSPFNANPDKGVYMWRDLERVCKTHNITLNRPSTFPQNGLLAARIVSHFSNEAWIPEFVRAIYMANFAHNRDITSSETICHCLPNQLDAEDIIARATSPESKLQLRKQTEEASEKKIFGAPSFYVGDELFWGNDRLEQAIAWAVQAAESSTDNTVTKAE